MTHQDHPPWLCCSSFDIYCLPLDRNSLLLSTADLSWVGDLSQGHPSYYQVGMVHLSFKIQDTELVVFSTNERTQGDPLDGAGHWPRASMSCEDPNQYRKLTQQHGERGRGSMMG